MGTRETTSESNIRGWTVRLAAVVALGACCYALVDFILYQNGGSKTHTVGQGGFPENDPRRPLSTGRDNVSKEGKRPGDDPEIATKGTRIPLRWLSPMEEAPTALELISTADGSTLTGKVEGAWLHSPPLERGVWYQLGESPFLWFPKNDFCLDAEGGLHLRSRQSLEERSAAVFVVQRVPVTLQVIAPEDCRESVGIEVAARLKQEGGEPESLDLRSQRWGQTLELAVPLAAPVPLSVPAWPLVATVTSIGATQKARWAVVGFSHRGKRAAHGDTLEIRLARIHYCVFEIDESRAGSFADAAMEALAQINAQNSVPHPSGSKPAIATTLSLDMEVAGAEDGAVLSRVPGIAKLEPASTPRSGGRVHAFSTQLTGLKENAPLAFILRTGRKAKCLAYGEAKLVSGLDQTIRLQAADFDPDQHVQLQIQWSDGREAPYHILECEYFIDERPSVKIESLRLMADERGKAKLTRVPQLDRVHLRIRSVHSQLTGSKKGWVDLGDVQLLTRDVVTVSVDGPGACPLTLKLQFAPDLKAPSAVSFLIVPKAGGSGGSAGFAVARGLQHGAVSTSITTGGVYVALMTWEEVFIAAEVDYHPVDRNVCTVAVNSLTPILIESKEDLFVLPFEVDAATAWTVSNFPDFERKQILSSLYIRSGKARRLEIADTASMSSARYGVLNDGSFTSVTCEKADAGPPPRFTVTAAGSGANGSLELTLSPESLASLKKKSARAHLVVTAVFSADKTEANATVGLGKRVEITGASTSMAGLPSGKYCALVMLETASGVPAGLAGDGWSVLIEISANQTAKITLPTK